MKTVVPPYPVAPRFRWPMILLVLLASGLVTLLLLWLIWAFV